MPTKCVSKPDEDGVKAAIKKVFDLTVPEVFIYRGYGRITVISGKACKRGQVTGLDSLFYPHLRKMNFRAFSNHVSISLFYSDFKQKIFDRLSIFSHSLSNQNLDEKENLLPESRNAPKIKSTKFRIKKSESKPVTCLLPQAYPVKTVTLSY